MEGMIRRWTRWGQAVFIAVVVISGCTTAGKDAANVDGPGRHAVVDGARPAPISGHVAANGEMQDVKAGAAQRTGSGETIRPEFEERGEMLFPAPTEAPTSGGEVYTQQPPGAKPAQSQPSPAPSRARSHRMAQMREVVPVGDGAYGGPGQAPMTAKVYTPQPSGINTPYYRDLGRDRFEHKDVNPVKLASREPVSTFSVDVDTASYAFVRKSINSGHLPPKDSVRVEEMINYFDYSYKTPRSRNKPFKPNLAVYPTPWNPDTLLLHIGIKGLDMEKGKIPRANLVFLIDVSGSMNAPDKLPLVQSSMRLLLDSLEPDDTIGIVVYAGAAGTVLEPTRAKDRQRILRAIERLRAGGSTAGAEGIRQAYALAKSNYDEDAVNRVILATDGDFNVGITNRDELKGFVEREREHGIYLSVLGFGMGNYNDELMQTLAQNGNGNAAYIDTLNEARKVLVDEAASTLFPIARDVKIQVEFNPDMVAEYRLIGYETRMLRSEDFNNDRVDAGDIGCGHTVTALYEITPVGSPARLLDELRYMERPAAGSGNKDEYAFLKIRYKLPREDESRRMVIPITEKYVYHDIKDVPADMRFAASVAAFGQMLRGGAYTGDFGYEDVLELAGHARGEDPFGYRAEFVNMVRWAKSSPSLAPMR